jgi:hypothetical protein
MNIHRVYSWISPRFRVRRLRWFRSQLPISSFERLLDVGGYPWCWPANSTSTPVTLLNRSFEPGLDEKYPRFTYVLGDACALPFAAGEFDVVFSNSVIEHVYTWERQQAFATEVRRVGRMLWIQTPAREFFIEAHLLTPFVHWLPIRWQRRLIRNFSLWGWFNRPSASEVDEFLAEVRLLSRAEMTALFPDCEILEEKFLGMTKSYIAMRRGGRTER